METLIGMGGAAEAGASDAIKDTDTQTFAADVLDASMTVPVVVDFWAPWCGPCKTLGPALEKAVLATRGKVRMVKVNVDQNQDLAMQMRVQSIPTVYGFFQGRPVDAFMGAVPESQIKTFVDKLAGLSQQRSPLDDALDQAEAALQSGDAPTAEAIYRQILAHDPENAGGYLGLAKAAMAQGKTEEVSALIAAAPAALAAEPELLALKSQIDLAAQAGGADAAALHARLEADPDDHQSRYDLAMALYGAGDGAGAIDALLEIIRRDRDWDDQAARKQLLKLFEALGPTDPLTVKGRRRLSAILFS